MASTQHDAIARLGHSDSRHHRKRAMHRRLPPRSSVGQFSFGPTTQTTVVTTTTTTTTNFPPFVMPGPRRASELDPRQYPLATTPTPSALKSINFSMHGKPVTFQEADDAVVKLSQVEEQIDTLEREHGTIQSVRKSSSRPTTRSRDLSSPTIRLHRNLAERPASPESISSTASLEGETRPSQPRLLKKTRRNGKEASTRPNTIKTHPRILQMQRTKPITPSTQPRSQQTMGNILIKSSPTQDLLDQPVLPSPDADLLLSPSDPTSQIPFSFSQADVDDNTYAASGPSHGSVVPTPPVEPEDTPILERGLSSRALSSIPARLQMSQSPSLHDGTLPSPSLSPVTASAYAQYNEYFADVDSASEFGSHPASSVRGWNEDNPSHAGYESPAATDEEDLSEDEWTDQKSQPMSSVADIPSMLNFFEALPDEFKSYVMHQLLRRCPKSTLHVVADVVNPALKCDFLTILPSELSLNILSYLDVQTLCRASQVSKKWRDIINSDESTWKRLFDSDGFTMPQGELQQAISQGWGWQDPYGPDAREIDLSTAVQTATDIEGLTTDSSVNRTSLRERPVSSLRRSKRKASTQLSNRNKIARRLPGTASKSRGSDLEKITVQVSSAEGPNNAANAAILAVPDPALPLPSLKGMHLFKSLYRRHHVIRKNWMSEDLQPHHIAFRAHDSHVVTCLQFDTDKILTGSDDNNINVYETKTGKLRKLLRGHEGGVWALQYIGNTLVSGSTDRSVRVWDIERGQEMQVFRGHTSTVRCLQILEPSKIGETADGKDIMMPKQPLIITGSRDSTLRIWRLPKSTDARYIQPDADVEADDNPWFVRTLTGHQHSVRAIAAHADTLVSGSYDCSVRVWKISTGETVYRLQGHGQKVYSVVLDHQRNRCISGSMDYMVKIWSLETGSALYTLEGHSSLVGLLDLNCDRLVSAAADSTLRIWDPENGQCKATLSAHTGAITCFQHDAQKVISGSDRTLKMWDIKKGECMKDLLSDLSGVWQVKFNERRCVAAVQRENMTFIEVLDFGAARDGVPESERGRRIVVDEHGRPTGEHGEVPTLMEM